MAAKKDVTIPIRKKAASAKPTVKTAKKSTVRNTKVTAVEEPKTEKPRQRSWKT